LLNANPSLGLHTPFDFAVAALLVAGIVGCYFHIRRIPFAHEDECRAEQERRENESHKRGFVAQKHLKK
jgi:hypothetical protein